MEPPIREHMRATFVTEYQGLRDQFVELVSDEDLEFRVASLSPTLGALCREIGEIEHAYVQSFRSFRSDFSYRHPDRRVEHDVATLTSWYRELDRELLAALDGLTADDIAHRRIVRDDFDIDGFAPLPPVQLDIYREALLIFYAKVSVYLQAMGRALPQRWLEWIG